MEQWKVLLKDRLPAYISWDDFLRMQHDSLFPLVLDSSSLANARSKESLREELQCRLSNDRSRIPMIFITAGDDPAARAQALKAGAVDFLRKPFAGDTLLDAIHTALGNTGDT